MCTPCDLICIVFTGLCLKEWVCVCMCMCVIVFAFVCLCARFNEYASKKMRSTHSYFIFVYALFILQFFGIVHLKLMVLSSSVLVHLVIKQKLIIQMSKWHTTCYTIQSHCCSFIFRFLLIRVHSLSIGPFISTSVLFLSIYLLSPLPLFPQPLLLFITLSTQGLSL